MINTKINDNAIKDDKKVILQEILNQQVICASGNGRTESANDAQKVMYQQRQIITMLEVFEKAKENHFIYKTTQNKNVKAAQVKKLSQHKAKNKSKHHK